MNYIRYLKICLLFTVFFASGYSCAHKEALSNNQVNFTINYSFTGIKKGYNHLTKTLIYLDNNLLAQTEEHKQSQKKSISIMVPKGKHYLEIVNMAYFRGQWEPHTKANGYNQDCFFADTVFFDKKLTINLIFDLSKGTLTEFRKQ